MDIDIPASLPNHLALRLAAMKEPNIVLVVTRPVTRMSRASIVIHRQIPDGSQIDALPTSVGKGKKFDIMQYFIKGDNDPKSLFSSIGHRITQSRKPDCRRGIAVLEA